MKKPVLESRVRCPAAVLVQKACKRYGLGDPILNNFNMTVHGGTIYGLLGASGCGKTTILSCIVGLRQLNSGDISVFGNRPGTSESGIPGKTIGYMPQEIALYKQLTIEETVNYFGRIYDMTQIEIQSRLEFLIQFLDLPKRSQIIGSLSGGQQRRTSLAVAMIHEPELLILDEPTVGVDPLIREKIWEYLGEMVQRRQTTVIITTHYIEEARQSNVVGLMRNGRLLVEKPPQVLLDEFNCNLLEDIVLKLCKKDTLELSSAEDDSNSKEIKDTLSESSFYTRNVFNIEADTLEKAGSVGVNNNIIGLKYKSRSPDYNTIFQRPFRQPSTKEKGRQSVIQKINNSVRGHLNKILSVLIRNYILLLRSPAFIIFFLSTPAIVIALINVIFDSEFRNIQFGFVNNELKSYEEELCLPRANSCQLTRNISLSCTLKNEFALSQIFSWKEFSSEAEALEDVRLGNSWGFMSIPANFTENFKDRAMWKNYVANETIDGTTITTRLDMADKIQSNLLIGALYSNYQKFIKKIVSGCGEDSRIVDVPLNFVSVYGSLHGNYNEYIQPAGLMLLLFFLPLWNSVALVLDRKAGTLDRSMSAGVKFFHVFAAGMISEVTMTILELIVCFGLAVFFFELKVQGSWVLALLICILTAMCGISFGFLLGTICSHEVEAMIFAMGFNMLMVAYSGLAWPMEAANPWVRAISNILPLGAPVESFRSIASRGWGIYHPHVFTGFATVATWTSLCFFITLILNRWKK